MVTLKTSKSVETLHMAQPGSPAKQTSVKAVYNRKQLVGCICSKKQPLMLSLIPMIVITFTTVMDKKHLPLVQHVLFSIQ